MRDKDGHNLALHGHLNATSFVVDATLSVVTFLARIKLIFINLVVQLTVCNQAHSSMKYSNSISAHAYVCA